MARKTKAGKSTKPVTPARKPVAERSAATVSAVKTRKPKPSAKTKGSTPRIATRTAAPAARAPAVSPAPKLSKEELRANLEKLEQLVTTLRARSREANKAAKVAAARIAELEAQVARLESEAAAVAAPVRKPRPARRQRREIDPGDSVPPGVAVEEAAPLDDEAETALENLEAHLAHE
jgi:hypothetical protein